MQAKRTVFKSGPAALVLLLLLWASASLPGCATAGRRDRAESRGVASRDDASVIVFSDVHFDPLADPSLAGALLQAPAAGWQGIFEQAESASRLPAYGSDSDYGLLKSALAAMQAASPEAEVVIFAGDLLPHHFEDGFRRATGDSQHADFEVFAGKTVQFVAELVRRSFPRALVVPVLGNNDSSCGDYMSQPRSAFLQLCAQAWQQPLADSGNYSVLLSKPGFSGPLRLIVLNDVYWSRHYSDSCGSASDHPDSDTQTWLEEQLSGAEKRGESVWLIGHIPAGLDLHASMSSHADLCAGPDSLVPMLTAQWTQDLLAGLAKHSGAIRVVLSGHTHMNEIRLLGSGAGKGIPWLLVPSVSPIFANNPGFEVLQVSRATGAVQDAADYALELQAARDPQWKERYVFSREYGAAAIDGPAVGALVQSLATDPALDARYRANFTGGSPQPAPVFSDWKAYFCSMTRFDAQGFANCYCGLRAASSGSRAR